MGEARGFQFGGLIVVAQRNTAALVGGDALLEGCVVELADVAEHFAKRNGLRPVWLNPKFVRQQHDLSALLRLDVAPDRRLGHSTDRGDDSSDSKASGAGNAGAETRRGECAINSP